MKALHLVDEHGNGARYSLACPSSMQRWNVSAFLDYMQLSPNEARQEGFLFEPVDLIAHERLRRLFNQPETTLNAPLRLEQNGRLLAEADAISLLDKPATVQLKRAEPPASGFDKALDLKGRFRAEYRQFAERFHEIFDSLFGFDRHRVEASHGRRVGSIAELADGEFGLLSAEMQLRFLVRVAQVVHARPFENMSKFLQPVRFRNGLEAWENFGCGFGGVCSEKVSALKFVCDVLDVDNRLVFGARSRWPEDFDEQMRDYVCTGGQCAAPLQIQHTLLEVTLGERRYLVDPTGGNVPLLFLNEEDMRPYMKGGYRARLVSHVDRLNLRPAPTLLGDALLVISEYHMPNIHFDYVFDDGLGLLISPKQYVAAYFDWGGEQSGLMQSHFLALSRRMRLPFPTFINDESEPSNPDTEFYRLLAKVRHCIKREYDNPFYTGDITLVVQSLKPNFWTRPNVSPDLRPLMDRS